MRKRLAIALFSLSIVVAVCICLHNLLIMPDLTYQEVVTHYWRERTVAWVLAIGAGVLCLKRNP